MPAAKQQRTAATDEWLGSAAGQTDAWYRKKRTSARVQNFMKALGDTNARVSPERDTNARQLDGAKSCLDRLRIIYDKVRR